MTTHSFAAVLRQFVVFAGAGGIGTAAHYAVLLMLVEIVDAHVALSSTCGFVVGAWVNYWLNYAVTFRSSRRHADTAPKYALVALAGGAINTSVMATANTLLGINYLLAQVAATALVLCINFLASRVWVFRAPGDVR